MVLSLHILFVLGVSAISRHDDDDDDDDDDNDIPSPPPHWKYFEGYICLIF